MWLSSRKQHVITSYSIHYTKLYEVSNRSISPVSFSGINLKLFDLRMKNFFHMTKQFESFLRDERPDIVHINGIWTPQNWLFQKAAQKLGIKVILSPHGMLEPYILNRHPAKKIV